MVGQLRPPTARLEIPAIFLRVFSERPGIERKTQAQQSFN